MSSNSPTVGSIAEQLGARFVGGDQPVTGLAALNEPAAAALTFVVDSVKYADALVRALEIGAVVLFPEGKDLPQTGSGSIIIVENPRAAFAAAVRAFFAPPVVPGIAANAVVDPSAVVSPSAHIGEFTVIGPGVVVGDGVEIRNHVVIAANVRIGARSLIKSHAVVGEEGLGVDKDPDGNNIRLPHVGSVVLGQETEVGSFATVCAGTITPTRIGDYSKIDDHVHVAHNVQIGRNVIVTGSAEIAGSVSIGDEAWVGPNSSILQGLTIGARALVGIGAVVTKSVADGDVMFGNPARRVVSPAGG